VISLIDDALKIVRANHVLYSGLSGSGAALVPTGALPAVPFRCEVTVSSTTGHADCAGSVTVGSETLAFAAAGKKKSTVNLTALPTITPSGLDCNILVEAISPGGAVLQQETSTAIKIRMKSKSKSIPSPAGGWESIRESYALSRASDAVAKGDIIRYGGQDYIVSAIEPMRGFASSELIRKLIF
jgi:hypothetical protein